MLNDDNSANETDCEAVTDSLAPTLNDALSLGISFTEEPEAELLNDSV